MLPTEQLQAVIFDLDGVITDTAEYHYQAWAILAKELGIPFTREFNENLKGVSRLDSLKLLLGQADAATSREYSPEELDRLATEKNERYQELINQVTPDDALPGILPLLGELKERGIKTAIASASKNAFTVVRLLGIEEQFDYIVDAGKLKRNKPDPEVFLTAAAALGVEPDRCIGVEDAAAGVEAIKAAGMFAVAIGQLELFPHADLVLPDTSRLSIDLLAAAFSAAFGR
ncbi:beta-phosphoglucomutase [Gorillibacterium timonense]|uniref:beta-phosphoglucomutase n=1 Tax=Gorillibacterium timonense TaxID=1689269 RepID=UPI00071C8E62|nr:beta-phosphoglucomutase [Gorillibacterium timonense]